MVRVLRVVVVLFGLGVIATVLIGSLMPRTWSVERDRLVRATPEAVQAALEDLRTWPEWTPWSTERDPGAQITFDGPERGVGARMSWQGQLLGLGSLTLVGAEPGRGVRYELRFQGVDERSQGSFVLTPEPAGTRVTWKDGGELTWNPMQRLFTPLLEAKLAHDFDGGLAKLAQRVER